MTEVDVAIVNWNTSGDAIRSARTYSASKGVDARVVIFDNASTPRERSVLEESVDLSDVEVSVILSDVNLGFGKAANEALRRGSAEYVLVSNADVVPEPNAVRKLIDAFESIPDCGVVAPVLLGEDGYHDELPGPLTLLIRIPVGGFNRKPVETPPEEEILEVGQPAGACLLTSRTLWEEIGGFDERFFLWYEDVDLAKRLRDRGKKSLIVGAASINHTGGRSFSRLSDRSKQSLRLDSLNLYLRLHHRPTYLLSRPL